MIGSLLRDVRFGVRMLRQQPGATAAAIVSLALGIGGTSAVYSLIHLVLWKTVPVEDAARLVFVFGTDAKRAGAVADWSYFPVSHPNCADLREQNRVFGGVSCIGFVPVNLAGEETPERVAGQIVSGNFFAVLGVRAALGRTFLPEEDLTPGSHPVVVLSDALWRRRYGADPEILRRQVLLNGRPFTVVGVTPPGFSGPGRLGVELWVPMMMRADVLPTNQFFALRRWRLFNVVARLQPGTTREQAESEVRTIAHRLEREYPAENEGRGMTVVPLLEAGVDPNQRETYLRAGGLLLAAVGVVLLIACANVANLLLVRALGRHREIAIRLSQGATPRRLMRQLLTESLLLALIAGGCGMLIAVFLRDLMWKLRPPFFAFADHTIDLSLDARVLAFGLGLSLVTGLLFGLVPALPAARQNVAAALKEGAPANAGGLPATLFRDLLVAGQIALAMVALVGGGLFLRSLSRAQRIDPGFETRSLLQVSLGLDGRDYGAARGRAYQDRLIERVEAIAGVRRASLATSRVLNGPGFLMRTIQPEGQESADRQSGPLIRTETVGVRYFETIGVPLRDGRDFAPQDREGSPPVAVINETMAKKLWPRGGALGRHFTFFGETAPIEIVGVVRDSKYGTLTEAPQPCIFLALRQRYSAQFTLVVRTSARPETLLRTVQQVVQELDRTLPLVDLATVGDSLAEGLWAPRVGSALLACFGLLALLMAAIGLYGVIAYSVRLRTREIGIRSALGAQRADVLRLVLRQALGVVGLGLAAGIAAALGATRLIAGFLLGITATDPWTFAAVALLLALVAFAASLVPAQRATRIDPLRALREA